MSSKGAEGPTGQGDTGFTDSTGIEADSESERASGSGKKTRPGPTLDSDEDHGKDLVADQSTVDLGPD